jgi:threonine dehydrogenase-like Zn-dependent dehydrogenase
MKVLRLHQLGDLRLHDEPIPQPGPGEELVRAGALGICTPTRVLFAWCKVGRLTCVH